VIARMAALPNCRVWYSCDRDTGLPADGPAVVRIAWLQTTPDSTRSTHSPTRRTDRNRTAGGNRFSFEQVATNAARDFLEQGAISPENESGHNDGRTECGGNILRRERLFQKPWPSLHEHPVQPYGIPHGLWTCTLSRQCGWARQYATVRRAVSAASGPSIG
jgi:hypothetical protein